MPSPSTGSWKPFPPETREVQRDEKWGFVHQREQSCDPLDPPDRLRGDDRDHAAVDPESRGGRKDRRMMETEWRPESMLIAEKLKAHAEAAGVSLVAWAVAWVLNNRAVSSIIAGPRTFEQWTSYFGALDYTWTQHDEALADRLVAPGHASTPGYNDPQYPIAGRFPAVA